MRGKRTIVRKTSRPKYSHDRVASFTKCQVKTPNWLVRFAWKVILVRRNSPKQILDLGAGNGIFATCGTYENYVGLEIDRNCSPLKDLPENAKLIHKCATEAPHGFDVALGNPPYTQFQHLKKSWRQLARRQIRSSTGFEVSLLSNLYVYFFFFSLIKTSPDGLVALIVPLDWVFRPSSKSLRDFIGRERYDVSVYRFSGLKSLFTGVETSASLTIVDKKRRTGKISFWDVSRFDNGRLRIVRGSQIEGLQHSKGSSNRAFRGFSPGSQKAFVLTENKRKEFGLKFAEVVPCVTSLRHLPKSISTLSARTFRIYYRKNEKRCWLLRTDRKLSNAARKYLQTIPFSVKKNWTCRRRQLWYRYALPLIPKIIYSSGFHKRGPKILRNEFGARVVGTVCGIETKRSFAKKLQSALKRVNYSSLLIPSSNCSKKIEIGQMNTLVEKFLKMTRNVV